MTTIEKTPITPFQFLEDERLRVQDEEVVKDEIIDRAVDDALERTSIDSAEESSAEEPAPLREELEYDVKISGNPIHIIAKEWKSRGYLPDELEIPEDITEEELEETYRKHKEQLIEAEVRAKVLQELRENGVDDDILETAKLLKYGVPQEEISRADAYQVFGMYELDPNDDNYEQNARQILTQFYADKGFSVDKIRRYVDRDLEDTDVEEIVADAQAFFREKSIQMKEEFKMLEARKKQEERQQAEQTVRTMQQYLDRGEIAGRRYTKEQMEQVRRALFDKTEVVVDAQGNRYRVSAYEKKRLEYQNNFELNLKSVVDFILGYDAKAVEEEGRVKGKSDALRELNRAVEVTIKGVREVVDKDSIQRRAIS